MVRLFVSTVIGVLLGIMSGLFIGWVLAPTEYVDSPLQALASSHIENYTLMIAAGYLADGDSLGAVERLRLLGVNNVPAFVQEMTERFITTSRDVDSIRRLVALSEGLGRLTPVMENFRQLSRPAGGDS